MIENDLLDSAIWVGISIFDYWNMSIYEIQRVVDVYNKKREIQEKEKANDIYNLAQLTGIGAGVYNPFSKGKFPKIEKVYPNLFKQEVKQQDWHIAKDRLLAFANAHNQKRGEL